MLYLRNTNQTQTLAQQIERGPAEPIPPTPPVDVYLNGLGRSVYNGNFDGAPNWFATATQSGSTVVDSGSLVPVLGEPGPPEVYKSNQWLGYFKASTTETYTFFLRSDDNSILWIGGAATASVLTTGSALINNPTSVNTRSGSIALTSGSYYPMRLQYADALGTQFFTSSFSSPTITTTTDYTGYTFCISSSKGF